MTRRTRPIVVMEISGISDSSRERSVEVVSTRTGRKIRLPRSQVDFLPGRVVLPAWLAERILGEDRGGGTPISRMGNRSV